MWKNCTSEITHSRMFHLSIIVFLWLHFKFHSYGDRRLYDFGPWTVNGTFIVPKTSGCYATFLCLSVCLSVCPSVRPSVCLSVCLFLFCFTSRSRIFPFTITDEWLQDLGPFLGALGFWAGRDLYRTTSAVTQDIGFPGLSRGYTFYLVAFYNMPEICSICSYPNPHMTRKCMTLTSQGDHLKKLTFTIFILSICHLWGSNSFGGRILYTCIGHDNLVLKSVQ